MRRIYILPDNCSICEGEQIEAGVEAPYVNGTCKEFHLSTDGCKLKKKKKRMERERETDTHKESERARDRERERQRKRQRERGREREIDR